MVRVCIARLFSVFWTKSVTPLAGPMHTQSTEAFVSAENWHEERDRLVQLLQAIELGTVTHIDEDGLRQLQATNPENIAVLKERLEKLNARLGDNE